MIISLDGIFTRVNQSKIKWKAILSNIWKKLIYKHHIWISQSHFYGFNFMFSHQRANKYSPTANDCWWEVARTTTNSNPILGAGCLHLAELNTQRENKSSRRFQSCFRYKSTTKRWQCGSVAASGGDVVYVCMFATTLWVMIHHFLMIIFS